ncbi:MAG TPA: hypothetical protein VGK64_06440 [Bryobacteraceae bacterium]
MNSLKRDEGVRITGHALLNTLGREAFLFAADERPHFVYSQIADAPVMNLFCKKLFAVFPSKLQNAQHRSLLHIAKAHRTPAALNAGGS